MAKLRNTEKLFGLALGETVTIGHNRTVTRRKYGQRGFGFQCKLHGHGVMFIGLEGGCEIAKVTLNDCGYPTTTTRQAMQDFARAFGCTLSVSFANGGFSIRFKNGAGAHVDRELQRGDVANGPFALGRWV